MRCCSIVLILTLLVGIGASLQAQTKQASSMGSPRRGFHADGSAWLWPEGTQEISEQESCGELVRALKDKLVLAWTMDRGVADLIAAANESRLDQNRSSQKVLVRLFHQSGKTEDVPTRVVILRAPGPEAHATDQMMVEAVLPLAPDITHIQLIDHQGVVAWAGTVLPHLLEIHTLRFVPAMGTDFLPMAVGRGEGKGPTNSGVMFSPEQTSRRALQTKHIEQGLYPPLD